MKTADRQRIIAQKKLGKKGSVLRLTGALPQYEGVKLIRVTEKCYQIETKTLNYYSYIWLHIREAISM